MPFDFKQDLQAYQGQSQAEAPAGGNPTSIGATDQTFGDSSVRRAFNFEEDLKQYEQLENAPATEALQVENVILRDKAIKEQEEENKRKEQEIKKPYDPTGKTPEQIMAETGRQSELDQLMKDLPDPRDEIALHAYLSPKDKLIPTPNIEIDYSNVDLSREDLTAVPEGTVGGHCGVYAENVVKLPGGGNWLVGDTIQEKTQSLEKYRKAGLAFKPGEDVPQAGNTIIQNPGTKWGHVAVINNIDEDGVATLTESNWNWDKRVTHTRKIRLDDPSIVGFIKTQ